MGSELYPADYGTFTPTTTSGETQMLITTGGEVWIGCHSDSNFLSEPIQKVVERFCPNGRGNRPAPWDNGSGLLNALDLLRRVADPDSAPR